jgi:hypothetical protein
MFEVKFQARYATLRLATSIALQLIQNTPLLSTHYSLHRETTVDKVQKYQIIFKIQKRAQNRFYGLFWQGVKYKNGVWGLSLVEM